VESIAKSIWERHIVRRIDDLRKASGELAVWNIGDPVPRTLLPRDTTPPGNELYLELREELMDRGFTFRDPPWFETAEDPRWHERRST
jgi:hypothetical protein